MTTYNILHFGIINYDAGYRLCSNKEYYIEKGYMEYNNDIKFSLALFNVLLVITILHWPMVKIIKCLLLKLCTNKQSQNEG